MLKRIGITVILIVGALVLALSALAQEDAGQAYLGITFDQDDAGALITRVLPGSPADEADLQRGDIITAVSGEEITAENFREMVLGHAPGDELAFTVLRDGENLDVSVTLGERPETPQAFGFRFPEGFNGDIITYNGADRTWEIRLVSENSPLYEAGLREGDIVTAFNGETYDPRSLREFVAGLSDDETVSLTVERDDDSIEVEVPASALSAFGMMSFEFRGDGRFPFEMMPFGMFGAGSRLGVTFVTLDEQVAAERDVDATEGALIVEVVPESPADEAGLQADDVVTAVNGEVVDAERTLRDRLFAYEPGDTVTLSVLRGAETLEIEVTLDVMELSGDSMPFFGQRGFGRGDFFQFEQPPTPEAPQSNL
jgi:S1-C subfamily serine protease